MSSTARKHEVAPEILGNIDLANTDATEYATRGAHARGHTRSNLRLVSPLRAERASRGVFILFVTGLLGIGLVAMLVINTALAQGAFTLSELQQEQAALSEQEAALTQVVEAASTPGALESQARALGMVPSQNPVFLRLPDGAILGNPKPAPGRPVTNPLAVNSIIETPADATALEAVSGVAVGTDLPIAPGENYDPAAADAEKSANSTNGGGKDAGKGAGKGNQNENSMWTEVPIQIGNTSTDAGLVAKPVN
ncbi:MAG: hypothetical protein CK552_01315 [Actinobacteria bacterium]|nr:MAG: hypothetical protein CK552_01315 [Actinomycetota bacterium]